MEINLDDIVNDVMTDGGAGNNQELNNVSGDVKAMPENGKVTAAGRYEEKLDSSYTLQHVYAAEGKSSIRRNKTYVFFNSTKVNIGMNVMLKLPRMEQPVNMGWLNLGDLFDAYGLKPSFEARDLRLKLIKAIHTNKISCNDLAKYLSVEVKDSSETGYDISDDAITQMFTTTPE